MKIKSILFAAILAAIPAIGHTNSSSSGQLSVQSAFVDRGVVVRDRDLSAKLELRVDDFVFSNVFASTELATTRLNINDINLRSDFGIGAFAQFGRVDVEASLNRLDATALYGVAYNEARAEVGVELSERLRVFSRVAYPLTVVPSDLFVSAGATYLIGDRWTADLTASAYQYVGSSVREARFNDAIAKLSYNVTDSLSVFGAYSYGGDGRRGEDLASTGFVGVAVRF